MKRNKVTPLVPHGASSSSATVSPAVASAWSGSVAGDGGLKVVGSVTGDAGLKVVGTEAPSGRRRSGSLGTHKPSHGGTTADRKSKTPLGGESPLPNAVPQSDPSADVDPWPTITLPPLPETVHRGGRRQLRASQWLEVPIFISSTFLDFSEERALLSASSMRKLEGLLQEEGYRIKIREIDLRWGITQDESDDNLGVEICLELAAMCRPFFVGLLGRRYGWQPEAEAYGIRRRESPLFAPWLGSFPAGRSVTELEMFLATCPYVGDNGEEVRPYALVYERDDSFLQSDSFVADSRAIPDLRGRYEQNADAVMKLKERLRGRGISSKRYPCAWQGGRLCVDGLSLPPFSQRCLEDLIIEDLGAAIRSYFGPPPAKRVATAEERTRFEHIAYAEEHSVHFMGREKMIDTLVRCATGDMPGFGATGGRIVAIVGTPGMGKSAVMARLATLLTASHAGRVACILHFIGPVPGSSSLREVISRLCAEALAVSGKKSSAPPEAGEFGKAAEGDILGAALTRACEVLRNDSKRLVLVVDSLNQLDSGDEAHDLAWLPPSLPFGCFLFVSTVEGRCLEALKRRSDVRFEYLEGLESGPQRRALVEGLLASYGKRLADGDLDALTAKGSAGVPLYLRLACEEVRLLGEFGDRGNAIARKIQGLSDTIPGLMAQTLERLEAQLGPALVRDAMCFVCCGRNGLAVDELRSLLMADATAPLRGMAWYGFEVGVRTFLKGTFMPDGQQLLSFFHRQLSLAVRERYLAPCPQRCATFVSGDLCAHIGTPATADEASRAYHSRLAALFATKRTPHWSGTSLRVMTEVLHHCAFAGDVAGVSALLTDIEYMDARVALGNARQLAEDFVRLRGMQLDPRVQAFDRFFIARAHAFARHACGGTVLNAAANMPDGSPVADAAEQVLRSHALPVLWRHAGKAQTQMDYCVAVLEGHRGPVNACSFSPDGRHVVTASDDGTARVWDVETGQALVVLEGHSGRVNDCAFSPNGRTVATASDDSTARVWDASSGACDWVVTGHTSFVNGCAYSRDGKLLSTSSDDKTARVWDAERRTVTAVIDTRGYRVNALDFSPDGRTAALGCGDPKGPWVIDAMSWKPLSYLKGHTYRVTSCAYSPDGRLLASTSDDRTARLWNMDSYQPTAVLSHYGYVTGCNFSPDGTLLVTASDDRKARVWTVATASEAAILEGHAGAVLACAFAPDGRLIATASEDRTVRLWDSVVARKEGVLDGHKSAVISAAFSPDGRLFATASSDNTVALWDAITGKQACSLSGHTSQVSACCFSPDGEVLASASQDKTLRLWDVAAQAVKFVLQGHRGPVCACAFSPDGQYLVSSSLDKKAMLWRVAAGVCVAELDGHTSPVFWCTFSSLGSTLATASDDRTVRLWDVASRSSTVLEGHSGYVNYCAFSPDGYKIATASDDGSVRVWDVGNAKTLATLPCGAPVRTCKFSPDGSAIVTQSNDRTLRLWSDAGILLESLTGDSLHFLTRGRILVLDGDCALVYQAPPGLKIPSGVPALTLLGAYSFSNAVNLAVVHLGGASDASFLLGACSGRFVSLYRCVVLGHGTRESRPSLAL